MNLSGRTLLLAGLVLLLAAAGQWAPEGAGVLGFHPSLWWRLPAAVLIILLIIEGLGARLLEIDTAWQHPKELLLARHSQLGFQVDNPYPRRLTVDVFLRQNPALQLVDQRQRLRINSQTKKTINVPTIPSRLGDCALPIVPLRVLGRFGLAWWSQQGGGGQFRVAPDSLHRGEKNAATRDGGDRPMVRRGHGLELLGLREYRPGDALKRIDWKATARSQRAVVRELAEEQRLELILVIDAGRGSRLEMGGQDLTHRGETSQTSLNADRILRLHHAINIASRLGELALSLGDQLTLIAYADRVLMEQRHLTQHSGTRRLRTALAQLSPANAESNPLAAALAIRRLPQHRSLIVWLTDFDTGDHGAITRAARMLMPRHLPMMATARDPALKALAEQQAERWADPFISLAASQAQQDLRNTETLLSQLGAEVVTAAPKHLDAAVLARYEQLRATGRV